MAEWFASGRVVDAILVLVAIEGLLLLGWRAYRGQGPSPALLVSNLAAGAALMLALRAALVQAHWTSVAICLVAALGAHVADMGLRFRRTADGAPDRGSARRGAGTPASDTQLRLDRFPFRRRHT